MSPSNAAGLPLGSAATVPQLNPILLYHVIWPNGHPHVLSSGLSSNAPLIGKSAGGTSGASPTTDGLQLQVTRPAGTSGSASVGAMLTGVTFPPGDYLFEATLTHASGPTTPANYLWAIVLVLKDGDQNDLPTDKRLAETLHFEKNGTGADSAIVTMPSLKNLSPPATDPTVELASADYSRVTATSHPAIDFTLRFRLDFGGGTGDATVAVNQLPGLGGTSTEYLRHGTIDGPARSVSYGTAGVLVNLARGDGMTASVILKDFKIFQI